MARKDSSQSEVVHLSSIGVHERPVPTAVGIRARIPSVGRVFYLSVYSVSQRREVIVSSHKIVVVTDSSAYIPEQALEGLNIPVIPLWVI
jgi:hypothetical protein